MKIPVILLVIMILLVGFIGGLAVYQGVFYKGSVVERSTGPYTYVYESYEGDYRNTGKVFDKIYRSLLKDGIKTNSGIGIYYDDPSAVEASKLRSDCGCVLDESDFSRLPALLEKYSIKSLPAKTRLVYEFPLKNSLSFMIGPLKAYPAIMEYSKEKGYNLTFAVEVYDHKAGKIYYQMELSV